MIFHQRLALSATLLILVSCGVQRDSSPSLGQAYVGPTSLALRQDVSTKAPVTATVHHGEQLEILEFKRKFLRVRTAGGITGWTEIHQLLTPEQMTDLRHIAEQAANYPNQGTAGAFEQLNVHTEPSRSSPSFLQIQEGGKVDVIGHRVTPRTQAAPPLPAPPPRVKSSRKKGKEKASNKTPPPPMPPAPALPANWQELSKTPRFHEPKVEGPPPPPVHMDDWSLIRTKEGRVGWVLSRMLTMGIPDDVAQYAEGHRITSYFQMGDVQDDNQIKHNWLWTTVGKGPLPYEFDSFRFFIWSKRHHRYETAYRQRDVVGHYPVEVKNTAADPTFLLILEGDDGKLYRKTFTFNGYRVSLVNTEPYQSPGTFEPKTHNGIPVPSAAPAPKEQSWYQGLKARVQKLFHR